ncbi:hypothetical protein ILT44_21425 [Microvirga sp. BT689]|uniref:DUF6894 family protein n=1 Tax=Microvirga arvi TaxID=2778731 RepID=UPI0019510D17|nr:hypothetical protein [Microvirga arvi]MBM6582771.1 hypothetical protein [Microvirga arvi]
MRSKVIKEPPAADIFPELPMRCYFHLVNCHASILDNVGVEVSDLPTAHRQALCALEELRVEAANCDWQGWRLDVADLSGSVLMSIPLEATLH